MLFRSELNGVILGMNSFSIPCSIQRFNVIITLTGRGIITNWVCAYVCVCVCVYLGSEWQTGGAGGNTEIFPYRLICSQVGDGGST